MVAVLFDVSRSFTTIGKACSSRTVANLICVVLESRAGEPISFTLEGSPTCYPSHGPNEILFYGSEYGWLHAYGVIILLRE